MKSPFLLKYNTPVKSLLSWERGLKFLMPHLKATLHTVAPLVGAWIEIRLAFRRWNLASVAPLVGAWIEILPPCKTCFPFPVAPLVGAWIEIPLSLFCSAILVSLLSWERGLKFCLVIDQCNSRLVAPLVGAWIEILAAILIIKFVRSLLSWERGLKYVISNVDFKSIRRSSRGSVD